MKLTTENYGEKWNEAVATGLLPQLIIDNAEGYLMCAPIIDQVEVNDPDTFKDIQDFLNLCNKHLESTTTDDKPKPINKGKKILSRKTVKKQKTNITKRDGKYYKTKKENKKTAKQPKAKKEPKTTKTTKEPKPKKPAYKIKPNWYKTLESFCKSVKKGSCMTYTIRTQVAQLQDRFDAKRGLNTPHIELIREIQDKLLPYANKDTKRVDLPKWESLIEKCKEAMHTITIIKKGAKEELLTTTLAGCRKRKTTRKKRK